MKKYNVLWIDDQYETQDSFIEDAGLEDIILFPFAKNKAGIDELKKNLDSYDAIILDALGVMDSEDERASLSGLQYSIIAINSFPKKIPYFIFSGEINKDENKAAKDMLQKEEVFEKGTDNEKLFNRIKEEADKQLDTQIRHENKALFDALETYGADDKKTIFEILRAIKTGDSELSDHLYFTPLRLILERMFRKANQIGILHDACVTIKGNQVNLTESSNFLAGKDCDKLKVRCSKTHFPKLIAKTVKNLLFVTGAASHTSEVDVTQNIDVQSYRDAINTPYLLFSLVYMLSDVLVWFDKYQGENQDVEANRGFWMNIDYDRDGNKWVNGTISRIATNGWGTVELDNSRKSVSVYSGTMELEGFRVGEKVKLTAKNVVAKKIERV